MMVLASAGSGKTYQLSNRIIGSIALGIEPATMVALTFTRKAAGEFTDAILSKLAKACLSENQATRLQAELRASSSQIGDVDFLRILQSLITAMPRMTLGTMDGFFTKVVKAFPLELGLSATQFQLIEGIEANVLRDQLLQDFLQQELDESECENFFRAFRQSMVGREKIQIRQRLEDYTKKWHGYWIDGGESLVWGPDAWTDQPHIARWMAARFAIAEKLRAVVDQISFTHGNQPKGWLQMAETFAQHTTGSGAIGKGNALMQRFIELTAIGASGDQQIRFHKDFTVPADVFAEIAGAIRLAADAERASVSTSTRAIGEVIQLFDQVCDRRLRSKGKLGFQDVKTKMGDWARHEDKRLMREALDYRLDAQYKHWLLDEFQDTSREDWQGLSPLIEEAMTNDEGTVFLVGDKKQAIYGWRGGDVSLFDDLRKKYNTRWAIDTMKKSYRSAAAVLDLVNRVCGDRSTMNKLYGAIEQRWEWEDHEPANPLLQGHARVECIEENEEKNARLTRMAEILEEMGIRQQSLSCGVLVRTNAELIQVVDFLRNQNFRVIEEGQRAPAKDHPLGIAIWHLLRWLADPADSFAMEVVRMSSLWPILTAEMGESPWASCHKLIHQHGIAATVQGLLAPQWSKLSSFARQRADDLLQALQAIDRSPAPSVKAAALMLHHLQVGQSPGSAEIQVMTIHKAKGLGFDVVILPMISNDSIPDYGKFEIAKTSDWICQTPAAWVRKLYPEWVKAESEWADEQRYEAMCVLYVALTRAKRGLYVLLEDKDLKAENTSLAQWIRNSCPGDGPVIFESGNFFSDRPKIADSSNIDTTVPALGSMILRHKPKTASKEAQGHQAALQYGTAMHALMESLTWLDEAPFTATGELADQLLPLWNIPEWRAILEKRQRRVSLFREIPVDGMVGENSVRGIIDRLHLFRDENGQITHAEIIDYKTDRVDQAEELRARHEEQLLIYRTLIAKALAMEEKNIDCLLLGLHSGLIVRCESTTPSIVDVSVASAIP